MFAKSFTQAQTHLFRRAQTYSDLQQLLDEIFPNLPFLYKIQYDDELIGRQTIESTKDLILFYQRQYFNLDLILLIITPEEEGIEKEISKESSVQEIKQEGVEDNQIITISRRELNMLVNQRIRTYLNQRKQILSSQPEFDDLNQVEIDHLYQTDNTQLSNLQEPTNSPSLPSIPI